MNWLWRLKSSSINNSKQQQQQWTDKQKRRYKILCDGHLDPHRYRTNSRENRFRSFQFMTFYNSPMYNSIYIPIHKMSTKQVKRFVADILRRPRNKTENKTIKPYTMKIIARKLSSEHIFVYVPPFIYTIAILCCVHLIDCE